MAMDIEFYGRAAALTLWWLELLINRRALHYRGTF